MHLWRISGFPSLAGEGGLRYSARWHSAGHRIVYLAESAAGALLEHLVHLELNENTWPNVYDLMQVAVPDGLAIEDIRLPETEAWKQSAILSRGLGDEWLRAKRTALARVPSAILPNTWNVLLNPDHPEAARVQIVRIARAEYDPRLMTAAPSSRRRFRKSRRCGRSR